MLTIDLDAPKWKTVPDFYDALLHALGAPKGHGHSANALIDSMIRGGLNDVEAPYVVRIKGTASLPKDAAEEVTLAKDALAEYRQDYLAAKGKDVDVRIETDP